MKDECLNCQAKPKPAGGFTHGQQASLGWPHISPLEVVDCPECAECTVEFEHEHFKCKECGGEGIRSNGGTNE